MDAAAATKWLQSVWLSFAWNTRFFFNLLHSLDVCCFFSSHFFYQIPIFQPFCINYLYTMLAYLVSYHISLSLFNRVDDSSKSYAHYMRNMRVLDCFHVWIMSVHISGRVRKTPAAARLYVVPYAMLHSSHIHRFSRSLIGIILSKSNVFRRYHVFERNGMCACGLRLHSICDRDACSMLDAPF